MEEEILDKCKKILIELLRHKDSRKLNIFNIEAFLEPVQWKELGLFDYPSIVKKPMDLSTVQVRKRINLKKEKLGKQ